MADVNTYLKFARMAIDSRDYPMAIKNCKEVLKKQKNNYMALVMLGVALQDDSNAVVAFEKAIRVKEKNILAYQGLLKFYQRINNEEKLVSVYLRILSLDDANIDEICVDLFNASLNLKSSKTLANVFLTRLVDETNENKRNTICSYLSKSLTDVDNSYDEEILSIYENTMKVCNPTQLNDTLIKKYLQCIIRCRGYDDLFKTVWEVISLYCSIPLSDWICKIFTEAYVFNGKFNPDSAKLNNLAEKLLLVAPTSLNAHFTKAIIQFIDNNIFEAYRMSACIMNNYNKDHIFFLFLGRCCLTLQRWIEAENIIRPLMNNKDETYALCAKLMLITSLASQNDPIKYTEGINLSKTVPYKYFGESQYISLFHAYINLQLYVPADGCLENLQYSASYPSLKAMLLTALGRQSEAFALLLSNNDAESLIELGRFYIEKSDYKNAFKPFLNAAKESPYNYNVFLCLGDFYVLSESNYEKAKKCYLKAMELNPECIEAGKKLSKIYMKLKDWEPNLALLKSLTNSVMYLNESRFQWAWLQLGLHHIAVEEWDHAVVSLRTYIRMNATDVNAWETLADAYYFRGSYTSALKCYKKAVEIENTKRYCHVQIGTIQCMLGQHSDALETFENMSDDYFLPSLKGLAEVKLTIANDNLCKSLYGLSRDNAQEAIDIISRAISKESHLNCLWIILYNSISTVIKLPTEYSWLYFDPSISSNNENDKKKFSGNDLYNLSIECLFKAKQNSTAFDAYVYHELASMYYNYYIYSDNSSYAEKAYSAVETCLKSDVKKWQHWNLMGIICASKALNKYSIAQHSFIKGLELDPCNSMLWSNLGVFYSIIGNTLYANIAFRKAQESNPTFIQSWIGQAFIAEMLDHTDTTDLFRHASQLGFHKESSMGYGYWVSKTICENEEKYSKSAYSIQNMHAIPAACHLMEFHSKYEKDNALSWNIYGILLEKLERYDDAIKAFEQALDNVEMKYRDIVLLNLGRTYTRAKRYASAIDILKLISDISLGSACELALGYFKSEQYKESYTTYKKALKWFAKSTDDKTDILISLACISHKFNSKENAEILLFQCIEMNKQRLHKDGLLALCALSMLYSEKSISELVLFELKRLPYDHSSSYILLFLETYLLFNYYGATIAVRFLSKQLRIYPANPNLWELLSRIQDLDSRVINTCAKKTLFFGSVKEFFPSLKLACVTDLLVGNLDGSKRYAQRAVMMNPRNSENWSLLVGVLSRICRDCENSEKKTQLKTIISNVVNNFDISTDLKEWYDNVDRSIVAH